MRGNGYYIIPDGDLAKRSFAKLFSGVSGHSLDNTRQFLTFLTTEHTEISV